MEGKTVWRKTTLPVSAAKILLQSDVAADHLPAIRQLANCPIFTAAGEIIGRGYHAHAGGTYISRGQAPPNVPLDAATTALVGLPGSDLPPLLFFGGNFPRRGSTSRREKGPLSLSDWKAGFFATRDDRPHD